MKAYRPQGKLTFSVRVPLETTAAVCTHCCGNSTAAGFLYTDQLSLVNLALAGPRNRRVVTRETKIYREAAHEKNCEVFGPNLGASVDIIPLGLSNPLHNSGCASIRIDERNALLPADWKDHH